jgi:hypothetical protein
VKATAGFIARDVDALECVFREISRTTLQQQLDIGFPSLTPIDTVSLVYCSIFRTFIDIIDAGSLHFCLYFTIDVDPPAAGRGLVETTRHTCVCIQNLAYNLLLSAGSSTLSYIQ